jgi:CO/xanthine dehydrogenase Mo-binding subunit
LESFRIIGKSYPRHESIAKATGQASYTDDIDVPGTVHGFILRSPHAHGRVVRIDKSEALKVPGVLAILLPEDVPQQLFNSAGNPPSPILIKDERILTDEPLYVGDRIAAVAALTQDACQEALDKLTLEIEPLPAVFEIEDALRKDAPLLHPEISRTNIFKMMDGRKGEVEEGFAESEHVFEGEYRTPDVQHMALEPVSCICHYAADGSLTVWSNTQTPFQDRRLLSELLDLRENRIRIIKPTMGGGFGGRQQIHNQHIAALLSKRVGRPVKIVNTREEELLATTARHGSICRVKMGVDKNGRLKAFHAKVYLNGGAYCTHTPIVLAAQARKFQYRIPHYLYEGYGVYTNAPVTGAMRGYGNPQITFARERMIDEIAKELDFDPIQFRMMNHLEVGETIPSHTFPLRSCAIRECVAGGEEIRKRIEGEESDPESKGGRREAWGVAFCCHTSGPSNNDGQSSCVIVVNDDGSVNLSTGSADIGQGCETTFSQIVAEELGIDLEAVTVTPVDTFHVPYDTGTFASGQIYVGGNAVREAALEVKERIRDALADHYSTDSEKVSYIHGAFKVVPKEGSAISLSFRDAVVKISFGRKGTTVIGRSSFKAVESPLPFAVCWAKVALDPGSKTMEVRHIIEAVDVGTAINPTVVRGQVEGGIGMGLGFALMEQIEIDKRVEKPFSSDLLHYKIPTALDMPQVHVYIAEGSSEPTGPFGAKSVGELPAVPVAAAIANAVSNLTGEPVNALPLMKDFAIKGPRELWQGIGKKGLSDVKG